MLVLLVVLMIVLMLTALIIMMVGMMLYVSYGNESPWRVPLKLVAEHVGCMALNLLQDMIRAVPYAYAQAVMLVNPLLKDKYNFFRKQ